VLPPPGDAIMTGSLTLAHNNQPGQSSIVFASATNSNSDYGYITFMDDVSNLVSERNRLLIGVHNDVSEGSDAVVLMPFGGYVGIGQLFPAYTLDVTGNVRATTGFVGNLNGNATTSSSCTGNAATATTATNLSGGSVSCTSFANTSGSFTGNCSGTATGLRDTPDVVVRTLTATTVYATNRSVTHQLGDVVFFDKTISWIDDGGYDTGLRWVSDGVFNIMNNNFVTAQFNTTGLNMNTSPISNAGAITSTGFNGPLSGNVTGNVTGSSGSCTGNASTATTASFANFLNHGTTFNTSNWYKTNESTPYNRFYFASNGITYINGSSLEFQAGGVQYANLTSTGLSINNGSNAASFQLDVRTPQGVGIISDSGNVLNMGNNTTSSNVRFYTDGVRFYILMAPTYTGINNLLRPFIVDLSNGFVGMNCNPVYQLDVGGSIRATADIIAYSDVRAKTNIVTISNALAKVNNLRGVTYAMKTEPDVQKMGVIAQEVEQVIPEVVSSDTSPEQKKSVAYGNITAVLIEAIKELTQRVEALERR
jgi:hypothetical protein